jgi:Thioesterase-like superfamily
MTKDHELDRDLVSKGAAGGAHSPSASQAYYLPRGNGRYEPTRATESPWDRKAQHGGPPAALLAHAIDQTVEGTMRIGRISLDFLGPIPLREMLVEVSTLKPGRRVCLSEARMSVDGRVVVMARAWHIVTGLPPPVSGEEQVAPPPVPLEADSRAFLSGSGRRLGLWTFHRVAVHSRELRHARGGGCLDASPATVD